LQLLIHENVYSTPVVDYASAGSKYLAMISLKDLANHLVQQFYESCGATNFSSLQTVPHSVLGGYLKQIKLVWERTTVSELCKT
jgi:hypothetical protein